MGESISFDLPLKYSVDIVSDLEKLPIVDVYIYSELMDNITISYGKYNISLRDMSNSRFSYTIKEVKYNFQHNGNGMNDIIFTEDKLNELIEFIIDCNYIATKYKKMVLNNIQKWNVPNNDKAKKIDLIGKEKISVDFSAKKNIENTNLISNKHGEMVFKYEIKNFSDNFSTYSDDDIIDDIIMDKVTLYYVYNIKYGFISRDKKASKTKISMIAKTNVSNVTIGKPERFSLSDNDEYTISRLIKNTKIDKDGKIH